MAIWADGDALSPDNMNNQELSSLTIGSDGTSLDPTGIRLVVSHTTDTAAGTGTNHLATFELEQTGNPFSVQVGAIGSVRFNHTSNFTRAAFGVEGFGANVSSGSVADFRAGNFVLLNSGTGSINTATAVFAAAHSNTGSGAIDRAIGLHAPPQTSGTTNLSILCEGVVSMVSSTGSIPSAVSALGYLYCSDIGALVWVGGSGTSTVIGAA